MAKRNVPLVALLMCLVFVPAPAQQHSGERAQQQNLRVIQSRGESHYWVRESTRWHMLDDTTKLAPGHTIKTGEHAELHLSFEPAITTVLSGKSLLNLNNLRIDRVQKAIRMRLNFQEGRMACSMPSDFGYTLLFTAITPTAHIYVNNADFTVTTDRQLGTILEVHRGSVKILHNESEHKAVVDMGNRAEVKPGVPDIAVSLLTMPSDDKLKRKSPRRSVAMLSVYSKVVSKENLEPLSDHIAQAIEKQSNTQVLFLDDVRAMLRAERVEQLLYCTTDSCISKIGSFLGVDLVVIGRLGQVGNRYLFNLKMIDALRDKTTSRINAVVDSDIGVLFNEVPGLVDSLIKGKMMPEMEPEELARDSTSLRAVYKEMVWIFPGSFSMGTRTDQGKIDELPLHRVSLNGFYIDKYEVSRYDFQQVMGYNPSKFKGCPACPVENVSWFEAQEYCHKSGKRLPTEAEWEYACRAGTVTAFHYGEILSSESANFNGQKPYGNARTGPFRQKPLPVGSFPPNAWGLFDMHGNVAEWCADWYDVAYYGNADEKDPRGPKDGQFKVARGGSWLSEGAALRSANRLSYNPSMRLNTIGFRCVKDAY